MATTDKYDRQVRIWGQHGQQALLQSSILLLGCDPAGVETLKNLILPGVGTITIVDEKLITHRDTKNNFFLPSAYLGQPRAKVAYELLIELNPDVNGNYFIEDPVKFDSSKYSLVIFNELPENEIINKNVNNAIYLQSQGFIGKIRLYGQDHCVIESKPMGQKLDLRVMSPFPELKQFMNEIQMKDMDEDSLAHFPYLVILEKALEEFKSKYHKVPQSFNEKQVQFRQIIVDMSKMIKEELRENFQEALDNIYDDDNEEQIQLLKQLFGDERKKKSTDNFWVFIDALEQFLIKHNKPPLQKQFIDMKCTTQTYLRMKEEIYGKKYQRDFEEMKDLCESSLKQRNGMVNDNLIEELGRFIENVMNLRFIQFRTYEQEIANPLKIDDFEFDSYKWYAGLRAQQIFYQKHNKYPQLENIEEVYGYSEEICKSLGVDQIDKNVAQELCRYQNCKLHNIAAIIGGMASQEAIKLLTKQFVPVNNTIIFNGLNGETAIYQL